MSRAMIAHLKNEIEQLRARVPSVKYHVFDPDSLRLDLCVEGIWVSVTLPDEYPEGEPFVWGQDELEIISPGDVFHIAEAVAQLLASGFVPAPPECLDPSDEASVLQSSPLSCSHLALRKDVEAFAAKFGADAVEVSQQSDLCFIVLKLPLRLDVDVAATWGPPTNASLHVKVRVDPDEYLQASRIPHVTFPPHDGERAVAFASQLEAVVSNQLCRCWGPTGFEAPRDVPRLTSCHPAPFAVEIAVPPTALPCSECALDDEQVETFAKLLEMGFETTRAFEVALTTRSMQEAANDPRLLQDRAPTVVASPCTAAPPELLPLPNEDKTVGYVEEEGFLSYIADYVLKRVPTLSRYCFVCDRLHLRHRAPAAPPVVCADPSCEFIALCQAQVAAARGNGDVFERIPIAAELRLVLLARAAQSHRAELVLNPRPSIEVPRRSGDRCDEGSDLSRRGIDGVADALRNVADRFVAKALGDRSHRTEGAVHCALTLTEVVLQQWVAGLTPRILPLDASHRIASMGTDFQYRVIETNPIKLARFAERKMQGGTSFAFHGSPIENWFSILHTGLRNATGTPLQLHGAALGPGVYLATEASTAASYCKRQRGEGAISCLALCEVANSALVEHGACWTVVDESAVAVRVLFLYLADTPLKVNTTRPDFIEARHRCLIWESADAGQPS